MLSTLILFTLILALISLSLILWAFFLRIGLGWAKVPDVTTSGIVVTIAIVFAIQLVLTVCFRLSSPSTDGLKTLLAVLELATTVLVNCLVISRVFKARFFRSLQAWLPTLASIVAMYLLVYLVFRPFLYEAFTIPTNQMAPTLLGNHWRSVCPKCGQPNFCVPIDFQFAPQEPQPMICENFHVTQSSNFDQKDFSADSFLVAKFYAPRRWDIIVFQYPENPSSLHAMRLIGLPGEKIHIEGGAVWANGNKLTPPAILRGIKYLSEIPGWDAELWGSKDRPAVLGEDEYFVLGDFSIRSKDSRLWEQGSSGHNPFAVPKSHIYGVVTHIYWPPQRWRTLR